MMSISVRPQHYYGKTLLGLCILAIIFLLPSSAASQRRIIGGVSAQSDAWPWMAAIVDAGGDLYADQYCGGTLIHSRWVMTAAHCVYDNYGELVDPEDIEVVLGVTNLRKDTVERIAVDNIVVHPNYDHHKSNDADIALLELETESLQEPIAVFSGESDLSGKDSMVIGWGVTGFSSPSPSQLQQASVPIVSNTVCNDAYTRSSLYHNPPITSGMMCAGFASGSRDTCFGDSGGPLMILENGEWKVAGITSWGEGCAKPGFFGVYTRVAEYLGFIEDNVPRPIPPVRLFFPYIVSDGIQETEIVITNTGYDTIKGTLKLFKGSGTEIESEEMDIFLPPFGRKALIVGTEFSSASDIRYIIFETTTDHVAGYERVFSPGFHAMSLPAVSEINSGDLYLPLAVSNPEWETEVHLLNTTSDAKELHFRFEGGEEVFRTLGPFAQETLTIQTLFAGTPFAGLSSAVIENSSGILGLFTLEVVGAGDHRQLTGFQLTDQLVSEMSCFHLGGIPEWWTGILIYNPWDTATEVTLTSFADNGEELSASTFQIQAMGKYVALSEDLNLPSNAAWFRATTSQPVTGFEMIGSGDGKAMDGNNFGLFFNMEGLFSRIEPDGWTALVLLNTEERVNEVTLEAFDENGVLQGVEVLNLSPHQRYLATTADIFDDDISHAAYIHFSAEESLSAFQINGSSDGNTIDTLPALGVTAWRNISEEENHLDMEPELSSFSAFPLPFLSLMN